MIIDNKAHARKGKSLAEFSAKKIFFKSCRKFKIYFLLDIKISFFALCHLRWNDVLIKLCSSSMSNKAEPFNLIQIFPLLQPAPVTFHPGSPPTLISPRQCAQLCFS